MAAWSDATVANHHVALKPQRTCLWFRKEQLRSTSVELHLSDLHEKGCALYFPDFVEPLNCCLCHKTMPNLREVEAHIIKTHTIAIKGSKKKDGTCYCCACEACSKSGNAMFKKSSNFKRELWKYLYGKRYQCPSCFQVCADQDCLRAHRRICGSKADKKHNCPLKEPESPESPESSESPELSESPRDDHLDIPPLESCDNKKEAPQEEKSMPLQWQSQFPLPLDALPPISAQERKISFTSEVLGPSYTPVEQWQIDALLQPPPLSRIKST